MENAQSPRAWQMRERESIRTIERKLAIANNNNAAERQKLKHKARAGILAILLLVWADF